MKVFKTINCKNSTEKVDDVIKYISEHLKSSGREKLISRIRNYRTYGFYVNTDSPRVPCEVERKPAKP